MYVVSPWPISPASNDGVRGGRPLRPLTSEAIDALLDRSDGDPGSNGSEGGDETPSGTPGSSPAASSAVVSALGPPSSRELLNPRLERFLS